MRLKIPGLIAFIAIAFTACSEPANEGGAHLAEAAGAAASTPAPPHPSDPAFASPSDVKAFYNRPHVDVTWANNATTPGGVFIEFNMNPGEDFTLLDAAWPGRTNFQHPDVAPDSSYTYRIRPFFGWPSEVVEITTGDAPPEGAPVREGEGPLEEMAAPASGERKGESLRSLATGPAAAPAAVTAELSAIPTNVELRWEDRASDEEGYLVELAPGPEAPFQICALLPADATSFRKILLPGNTACRFRVRAYFSGIPSALATASTR